MILEQSNYVIQYCFCLNFTIFVSTARDDGWQKNLINKNVQNIIEFYNRANVKTLI